MNDSMAIFMISDGGARVNECISTATDRLHMMPISQVLKLEQLLLLTVMTFFIFEILALNLDLLPSRIFSNLKMIIGGLVLTHLYDVTQCLRTSRTCVWFSKF